MLKYSKGILRWRNRRFWLIVAEYGVSVVWSYTMVALFSLWLLGKLVPLPPGIRVETLIPGWTGLVLGMLCLFQFGVSLWIDRRFERGLARYLYWTVWYPLAYWLINITTTVVAVPRAFGRRDHGRAVWVSPDRGVRT
jgi:biofilm PGA synthesis N-glycosyltransferase PgaC